MQGKIPFPDSVIQKFARTGGEICKNVFVLSEKPSNCDTICAYLSPGKSGLITTPNGLRIACLGGIYDPEVYSTSEAAPVR